MKIGIIIPNKDLFKPSFRFMKQLKEGLKTINTGSPTPDKEKILDSHNILVPEFYHLIHTGLMGSSVDPYSLEIRTKHILLDEELDIFLEENKITLPDRIYYDANGHLIYFDTNSERIWIV